MAHITVAKAACTPARDLVKTALQPYGVKIKALRGYSLYPDGSKGNDTQWIANDAGQFPARNVAEVTVNDQAAAWAEYLLLRTGRLELLSRPYDQRNERWAAKWAGAMPKPWREKNCGAGEPGQPAGPPELDPEGPPHRLPAPGLFGGRPQTRPRRERRRRNRHRRSRR